MKSPWTIAIEVDHLRPKGFVKYSRISQVLRPLKAGDRVFLFSQPDDAPAYGKVAKIKHIMSVNGQYYHITFEGKKKK